ncbi:DUF3515 family protein [uncultured Nocardioides sp.]|uniref:DUF3515 family protein n=1 Tax=uncultured Nocardioides sp. TaxID=198441 RepID=UPI000C38C211|nr:DUF3515 family protein [uncultured Nocardioides sp.]MAY96811.1 hypothetical protein [Nocardioides sp.]
MPRRPHLSAPPPSAARVRRPVSRRSRGVVACAVALLASIVLAGCSGTSVEPVGAEPLDAAGRAACEAFLADLPSAADGALVTCGAPEPATLEATSECDEVRGVGWFIDPEELSDAKSQVTATAIGVRPRVAVVFPPDERGQRSLEVLSALADPVTEHLERVSRCR